MAEETAVIDAPAEAPASAPVLRPEAMASLDALSKRIHAGEGEPAPEVRPSTADAPAPIVPEPKPTAAAPEAKPPSEVPTLADLALPPGDLAPAADKPTGGDEKPTLPSVDEVFPEKPAFEIRSEKGRENYAKQRDAYKAMEHRLKELETSAATPKPDEAATARIADLEARNAEMSKVVERATLLEHPAFIAQFEAPLKQLKASAAEIVKSASLDPEEFDRVLSLTGNERIKAFDTLTAEMDSPTLRRKLERTLDSIEEKEGQRAQVLSDTKGNLDKLRTAEKIRQHQTIEQQTKQINALVDGVVNYFATEAKNPFFQKGEGKEYETWNSQVDADTQKVRDLVLNCKDEGELTSRIALGVVAPRMMKAYATMRTRCLELEKQLSERNGARPDLGNGRNGNGSGEADEDEAGDMSADSIRSRLIRSRR